MLRLVGDADLRTAKRQFLGEITNSDQNRISSQQSGLYQGQKGRDFITTFNQNTNIAAANANGALLLDALAVPPASRTSTHHTLIHEEYLARQQLQSVNKKRDQPHHDSTFLSSINASAIPEASLLVGHRKSNQAPLSTIAAVDIPHQKVLRARPDPNAPLVNTAKDVLGGGGGGATTSTKSVAFADPMRFIKQDANTIIPSSSHLSEGMTDEGNTFNGYLETEIRAKVAAARAEVRALTDALIGSYGMALFADLFTSADLRQQKKLLRTGGANADEKSDQAEGGLTSESVDNEEGDNDAQVNLRSAYEKNQLLRIEARRQQLLFEQKQHEAEVVARQNQIANPNAYLYGGRNAEKKPMGEIAGHPLKDDHLPHLPSIRNPHHTAAEAQFLLKQYRLAMDAKDEVSQSAKREAYAEEQLARLGKLSQISAAALATARERMASEEYKIAKRRQSFMEEKNGTHQGNNNNSSLSDETVSETINRNVDASGLVDDYTQTNEIKTLEDLDDGEEEYGTHNNHIPTSTAVATVQRVKPLVHEDIATPPNNSPPSSSSPVSSIRQIQAQVLLSYIMQAAAHYDPNAESRLRAIGGGGSNNKRSSHHHEGENDDGEESDFYDDGEGYLYDDEDPIDPHEYNLLRFAKGHHRHLFDRRQLPSEDDDDNVRRDRAKESRKKRSDELIRENVDDKDRFFKTIAAMRGEADPKKYKKLLKEYYRNRSQQTRPPPVRFAAADADVYPYPTTTSSSGHHTNGTINSSDVLVSRAALHRNQESTLIGPQLISAIISTSTAPSESPSPKLQRRNHSSSKVTKTLRIEKNKNNASTTFDESTLDPTIANRNNNGARQKIANKIVMEKKSASFSSSSPLMKRQEDSEGPNKKYPSSDTSKNSGGSNSILKKSTSYQNAIEVEKVVEEDEHDRRNAIIVKEGKRSNAGGSKLRGGNTMWAGGNASDAGTSITSNKGGLLPSGKAIMGRMMGERGGGSHSDTHTLGSNTTSPIRNYNNDRGKHYHDSNVSTATMDESTTRKGRNQNRGGMRRETSDGGSPKSRSSSSSTSSSTSSYSRRNNRRRNDSSLTSATEIADSSSYRPQRGGTVRGKNNKNLRSDSSSSHSSDAVMNGTAAGLKAVEGPRRAKNNGFFDASQNNNTTTNSGDANKEPKKKKGFWKRVISGIFGNKKNKGKKDDGNHTKAENKTGMTRPEEDDDEGSANLSGTDDEDGRPSRGRARSPTSSSSSATSKNSVLRGPTLKKNKNDDHSTDDANAARSFANTNTDASQSPRNNRREGDEDSSRSTSVSSTKQPAAPPVKKKSSLAVFSRFDCMGGKGGTVD